MRSKLHQFVIAMKNPASSLLMFVASFRLAWGCAHSSLFSGISFHLCAHSHVAIVPVLRTYTCWMGVGQKYAHPVEQIQISYGEIRDSHTITWKQGFGISMKTISKELKRHYTLHCFTSYWIHSEKSVFKCGTQMWIMECWEWDVFLLLLLCHTWQDLCSSGGDGEGCAETWK